MKSRWTRRKRAGFTLVETALALGIVAFALVPLIGLLPIGMQASRHASDLTIASQIAQRLSGMVAQDNFSDFSALVNGTSNLEGNLYYFDSEGQPITTNSQGQTLAANASPPANAVYTALHRAGDWHGRCPAHSDALPQHQYSSQWEHDGDLNPPGLPRIRHTSGPPLAALRLV